MAGGRPPKKRVTGSGEKLLAALRMVGLTWSSANVHADNHVLNNKRWRRCGLPRSATTIANDIRLGLPQDRIDKYASFFGVTPDTLADELVGPNSSQFTSLVLKNKPRIVVMNPLPLHTEDPLFCNYLRIYNNNDYNIASHTKLKGLFIVYLLEISKKEIFKVAVNTYSRESDHLEFKGFSVVHKVPMHFKGRLFRFGTFIHVNYISNDAQVLGYIMTHDPSTPIVASYKLPFRLPVYGLAGSMTSAEVPDRMYGVAEKVNVDPGGSIDDIYAMLCRQIEETPLLIETDANYWDIYDRIHMLRDNPGLFHLR